MRSIWASHEKDPASKATNPPNGAAASLGTAALVRTIGLAALCFLLSVATACTDRPSDAPPAAAVKACEGDAACDSGTELPDDAGLLHDASTTEEDDLVEETRQPEVIPITPENASRTPSAVCEAATVPGRCTDAGRTYEHGYRYDPGPCRTCTCDHGNFNCIEREPCEWTVLPDTEPADDHCPIGDLSIRIGNRFPGPQCQICQCRDDGAFCTGPTCQAAPNIASCQHETGTISIGATFLEDGSVCRCNEDGNISCIFQRAVPRAGCVYLSMYYEVGATFDSTDGCSTCTCTADNVVRCTCPEPLAEGCDPLRCNRPCTIDGDDSCDRQYDYCKLDTDSLCEVQPFGTCQPKAENCPDSNSTTMPVCGCDGATYGSQCEASFLGRNVAYPGRCVPWTATQDPYRLTAFVNHCLLSVRQETAELASCTFLGQTYPPGATYDTAMGCGTCVCNDGKWACTQANCAEDVCTAETCDVSLSCIDDNPLLEARTHYPPGTSFTTADECRQCTCLESELLYCTLPDCP